MPRYKNSLRGTRMGDWVTLQGSGGTLAVYTGSPTGPDAAAAGTLLATLTGVSLSLSGAVVTITATGANGVAAGTPGMVRAINSSAVATADFSAGLSGAECNFDRAVQVGGLVSIGPGGFTVTEGNA